MTVNDGPTLDWTQIRFREPLTDEEWYRLAPEWRLDEAITVQLTGNVPFDG